VEGERLGRPIGVYPETKHPSFFAGVGLALEEPLLATLRRRGLDSADAPVLIQSFEVGNLVDLAARTRVRLIQLLDSTGAPVDRAAPYREMASEHGLAVIAEYAYGIGAHKDLVAPRRADGSLQPATSVVDDAHAAGLAVHAWTFRAENRFLPLEYRIGADPNSRGDIISEYEVFLRLGVDGLFTDHPDTLAAARLGLLTAAH
jgi:glycerophosphoryl diester phosphodiesterase